MEVSSVEASKKGFNKMAVVINKRLLDAKNAAEYLSISRSKLYQWVKKGKIPSITIDTCRLFDVQDLDLFVDELKNHKKL
jgi:excisionase family DNA binding protein